MSSFSKQPSSGKPKLDRRNARKISDYEPADSPTTLSKSLNKGFSKSFRVLGLDSKGEIEKICEELGLPGGADAFSIPQDAWEAGKAKSGSLERFILDHKTRSRSLDDYRPRLFDSQDVGGSSNELANFPVHEVRTVNPNPFYNSMSSSSGDSFASDISAERSHFGSFEVAKEQVPFHRGRDAGVCNIPHYDDRRTENEDGRLYCDQIAVSVDPGISQLHTHVDHLTGSQRGRVGRVIEEEICARVETTTHTLLPPPPMRTKAYLPQLSTQELLASFAPEEHVEDRLQSDSEESQADVHEVEDTGFVAEVVQRHGASSKQEASSLEGARSLTPPMPEYNTTSISINLWRKLDLLGSGSFGTVYEALSEDGVYFAVKEVALSAKDTKAQQCVSQLEQEIEFLSKFQHENIVRYLGTQKEPDKLYIFLELVTKGSLSSLYQKYTLFDSQIRSYTRQILNGLKYLHERKIMHRDIKCANILVDVSGKIKLADFGLAKQISQLDELKSCKGSAYWMAPEVIDPRKTYSFPADIWSLGCTVLEMQTRRPPFGDMEWHRVLWKVGHGEAPPIPEDLSEDAKDFIRKCLEVDPVQRASASELLDHPFVQNVGGTGLTPRNSFTNQETAEL